ncbi:hemopexin repeat-containing protein [Streptomyces sp. NPDC059989]|uniref:hemopexin repeat-containing protein n=1 Tax=Streptomyces sp. NPDC059989 TaxID=3347026 RepID=UPI0036837FAD
MKPLGFVVTTWSERAGGSMGSDGMYYYALIETTEGKRFYVRFSKTGDTLDTAFTQRFEAAWKGSREAVEWLAAAASSGSSLPSLYLPKTGKVYFMHGATYVRCTMATHTVDDGYPKTITSYWPGMEGARFGTGNTAALSWDEDGKRLYLFNRDEYVRYDLEADKVDEGYPKTIGTYWAGLSEAGFGSGIDAFVRWDTDTAYAFKGDQYVRYNIPKDKVDPGYPRKITDHWSALAQAHVRRVLALWKAPATETTARSHPVTEADTTTPAFLVPDDDKVEARERLRAAAAHKVHGWAEFDELWEVAARVAELKQKPENDYTAQDVQAKYTMEAVRGFFDNGGKSCYIVRRKRDDHDYSQALTALERIPDVHMVVAPTLWLDKSGPAEARPVMQSIVEHCRKMGNRVAILDMPLRSDVAVKSSYATAYTPWVKVPGLDDRPLLVPPAGHIAGVWARTDVERGVHEAPDNTALKGVLDLDRQLNEVQAGALNEAGTNCLRMFPEQGVLISGARTTDQSDRDYKYLNVRRLVCHLGDSIKQSTRWAVFEPNEEKLWGDLRNSVTDFLMDQWRRGALAGGSQEQAFSVICDASNNKGVGMGKGCVVIDIGIAPVRPAEFIVFQVKQVVGADQGA